MSPERKEFDLGDYVQVKDRIAKFYELYGNGRLVTADVVMLTAPDEKQRVMVKALAYRNPDDPLPGVGYSWLELPGTTPYTKGSEVENAETSAWGRAIASLGILTDHSIASFNEVRDKSGTDAPAAAPGSDDKPTPDAAGETEELLGRLSKSGTVKMGAAAMYKLERRETPNGPAFGFRLEIDGERAIPQVLIEGPIAEALLTFYGGDPSELNGRRVTVKGRLYNVRKPGRQTYYRLRVSDPATAMVETPDVTVPAPAGLEPEPTPVAPGQVAAFDESEQADIAAAVDAAPAGVA